jgi:hypothetical protein
VSIPRSSEGNLPHQAAVLYAYNGESQQTRLRFRGKQDIRPDSLSVEVAEEPHAMAIFDRTCPYCGAVVHQAESPIWDAKGFPCPACGQRLRSRRRSLKLTWAITLPCAVVLSLLFGLRGWSGLFVCLGISVPLSFVIHSILGIVFAPPLDAFRGERQRK